MPLKTNGPNAFWKAWTDVAVYMSDAAEPFTTPALCVVVLVVVVVHGGILILHYEC